MLGILRRAVLQRVAGPARLALLFVCVALVSSCGIVGLKKHLKEMESHGSVAVRVSPPPDSHVPTYALAWRMEHGLRKDAAGFQRVRADGVAAFSLKLDQIYRVGAFTDENGNGKYDAGEPLDIVKDVKPLPLGDPGVTPKIWDLTLTREHGLPPGTVIELPKTNEELGDSLRLALGEVVSLDDPRFVADAGGAGHWRPHDFLRDNTMGIYFTEAYDPNRMPVLFVNGIGGSPQDGRFLIEHLDRKRYQLWFYHYPSGMRLDRVAKALSTGLGVLKRRLQFAHCDVVAHSMGGLVSRVAIYDAVEAEGADFIPKFVSISTPWGGHKAAKTGIRMLKHPVPSWIDVCPNSDFLVSMYTIPLPPGTEHHLIYGVTRNDKDDGVATVESQTDPRIAASATSVTRFPYEHTKILFQYDVLARVSEALASQDRN
jgi:pimeloyl-ACP methyl ester carboxylesterase